MPRAPCWLPALALPLLLGCGSAGDQGGSGGTGGVLSETWPASDDPAADDVGSSELGPSDLGGGGNPTNKNLSLAGLCPNDVTNAPMNPLANGAPDDPFTEMQGLLTAYPKAN